MLALIIAGIVTALIFLWAVSVVFDVAAVIDDKFPVLQGAMEKLVTASYYIGIIGLIMWIKLS